MPDRQRGVFVGAVGQGLIDEQMARRTADGIEHLGVRYTLFAQALDQALAGTLGGHADTSALQIVLFAHQSTPSSQPWSCSKASLKVRSSCSGVIDT
ncbi:hypothetical protein D3C73_1362260 [compost metagenome]